MRVLLSLLLVLPPALAACDSTAPDPPLRDLHPTVTIRPALVSLDGGATVRLTIAFKQTDGTILHPIGAAWKSSDLGVATVANGGVVRAGLPGTALITAHYQGAQGSAVINVRPVMKPKKPAPTPCGTTLEVPVEGAGGCEN
jgi:Bacterial Ig-like domain (group 2)